MYDILDNMSYKAARKRAITVRVPEARLKQVMRARGIATQTELINTLIDEEIEKMVARKALEATAGKLSVKDFDARLL